MLGINRGIDHGTAGGGNFTGLPCDFDVPPWAAERAWSFQMDTDPNSFNPWALTGTDWATTLIHVERTEDFPYLSRLSDEPDRTLPGILGNGLRIERAKLIKRRGLIYLVVTVFFFLPDSPTKARWPTEEEKTKFVERVRANNQGIKNTKFNRAQAKEALTDPFSGVCFS